ncbi:MAG TPA: hypothetical protein VMU34_21760 [Mycobacterium sp.]|nr:hypothetical protein [Mycobacterium sp.]
MLAAYREAEEHRGTELDEFFRNRAVPFVRIAGSGEIRSKFVQLARFRPRRPAPPTANGAQFHVLAQRDPRPVRSPR